MHDDTKEWIEEQAPAKREALVEDIIRELDEYKGFRWWWDDVDDEDQEAIKVALRKLIQRYSGEI